MINWKDKKVIFVTGKGGTGKSTVVLALAFRALQERKVPLIVETDDIGVLSRIFHQEIAHEVSEPSQGIFACKLDFMKSIRDFISLYIPLGWVIDFILRNKILKSFLSATPAAREMVTMSRIMQLASLSVKRLSRIPDVIIVDLPASGHAVSMLSTPKTTLKLIRHGPIKTRAEQIDSFFADPRTTGVIITAIPEELAINEAYETQNAINERAGYNLLGFLLNFSAISDPALEVEVTDKIANGALKEKLGSLEAVMKRQIFLHQQTELYEKRLIEIAGDKIIKIPDYLGEGFLSGQEIAHKMATLL